jgi:hypothetical protein
MRDRDEAVRNKVQEIMDDFLGVHLRKQQETPSAQQ